MCHVTVTPPGVIPLTSTRPFQNSSERNENERVKAISTNILFFFLYKLPPYRSVLNPAQGPVAWCPGVRGPGLNFPRSSDSWWCAGRARRISQSGSGPGSGHPAQVPLVTILLYNMSFVNLLVFYKVFTQIINFEMSTPAHYYHDYIQLRDYISHKNKSTFEYK